MIFGKTDAKRDVLNCVGLDFSSSNYENKKRLEYEKFCKKALYEVAKDCSGKNESDFLQNMSNRFYEVSLHRLWLGVSSHYVTFANKIVDRRMDDIKNGNSISIHTTSFHDNTSKKRYTETLWDKYQYPWPNDWLKKDNQ